MTPPLVSVVMGAYNDAACLSAAIDGIRAQTLEDWELIVVNDGSTDRTAALLDRCAAEDRRITVIHQANAGLTQALIRGLRRRAAPTSRGRMRTTCRILSGSSDRWMC
ncbi:MAG: glycosyltransferase [Planctomycetaceae bacterium]